MKFPPQNSVLGKFGPKNSNLSVLSENQCTEYLKDADSKSKFRFLKFWPQNPFWGKFGSKNLKFPLMSENWYAQYYKDADSESRLRFLKFWPPKSIFWQIWAQKVKSGIPGISTMLILIPTLVFEISDNKSIFWQIWALSSLAEYWHTECLDDVDSYSDLFFLSFQP